VIIAKVTKIMAPAVKSEHGSVGQHLILLFMLFTRKINHKQQLKIRRVNLMTARNNTG